MLHSRLVISRISPTNVQVQPCVALMTQINNVANYLQYPQEARVHSYTSRQYYTINYQHAHQKRAVHQQVPYPSTVPISHHHDILIVGGGTSGITVAAQLAKEMGSENLDIAIIDPAKVHYYQPAWTLVGAGLTDKTSTVKEMTSVIPPNVTLIPQKVASFDPAANTVKTDAGSSYTYKTLVVAAGLQINWGTIAGLPEALERAPDVASIYSYDYADKAWNIIKGFEGGRALFTQPSTPIKCGGAPQKVMWMAEDLWRVQSVRGEVDVTFATGTPAMFAVPKYSDALAKMARQRNVEVLTTHDLVEVKYKSKEAVFAKPDSSEKITLKYDMLHVTPKMTSPDFIKQSALANKETGFVDVSPETLQSPTYPNIFAVGDCAALPTSKTAAAITSQVPVAVHNILMQRQGREATAKYDGYTSCPLLLGYGSLMLAEFKYGNVPNETFGAFWDQSKPLGLFYRLKVNFFPWVYWRHFLTGTWYGSKAFSKPTFPQGKHLGSSTSA